MMRKKAQFAGSWYPSDAGECQREIEGFIQSTKIPEGEFVCGIVPHAGWFFSGSIACRVMAALGKRKSPDLVLIFGMHMHGHEAPRVLARGGWETPLGPLDVHEPYVQALSKKVAFELDTPHIFPGDNTIEVQLPLVKYFFPNTAMVPVGIPPSPVANQIGRSAVEVAVEMGLDMVVVGSTDLTHYGENFGFTPAGTGPGALEWMEKENDAMALDAILSMDGDQILSQGRQRRNMCCAGAVAATVAGARAMGAVRGVTLDYATSFDKSPGTSFVGYTGVLFGQ
jgi:AmmeMemoRadiSam system protein B